MLLILCFCSRIALSHVNIDAHYGWVLLHSLLLGRFTPLSICAQIRQISLTHELAGSHMQVLLLEGWRQYWIVFTDD